MEPEIKISRFRKSWRLTQASWQALKMDKELFALPVIGFFVSLAVFIPAGVLAVINPSHVFYVTSSVGDTTNGTFAPMGYVAFIIVGLIMATISAFISGAVVHGAIERFKGNDPNVKSCLSAAWKHIGSLTAFTAFSFTIGYILSEIANRIPFLGGRIVVWLADAAWRIASFFAIPVIMTSDEAINPVDATKKSIGIIKQVWGESLIVSATVGLVALLAFLGFFGITIALFVTAGVLALPGIGFAVLGLMAFIGIVVMALVFSMLEAFVKAAIYYYAVTGKSPVQFDTELLRQAFTPKKARKVFGA